MAKLAHFFISVILLLTLVSASSAQDVSISASVDKKTVALGDLIVFTIHVQGSQAIAAPNLPNIDGFEGLYLGPNTQVSVVNGQSFVSIDHRYRLRAVKNGRFIIPTIAIRYGDKLYRTEPIEVQVTAGSSASESKAMTSEDLKKYIRLDILTKKETAYINEGIPLVIRLYIRSGIEVQNIARRPVFPSAGFSVIPLGNPVQRQTVINGIRFVAVDFSTTVYPITTGELTLGPADMDCRVVTRPSRGRRGARYVLNVKSEPHTITVKPLPTAGQPKNFSGVVGKYALSVVAKPTSLKAGEPITLTMTVRGSGNIDSVGIPTITDLAQFRAYDPQVNLSKRGNTGAKTFEQVLIPISAHVEAIPEIQFSYFDPDLEQYVTQSKGPIPIQVMPSDEEKPLRILEISEGKAVKREVLGRDIVYIKDEIDAVTTNNSRLYKNKGFLLLQLLPLAGVAGVFVYQRRRERFATDRTYARQYHAPRKAKKGLAQAQELIESGKTQEFCSAIFKTMQEYLGGRFNLPSAGITVEIVDSLRDQGFAEEMLEKLTDFFQSCDRIRFARSEIGEHEMTEILVLAKEIIELLGK